MPLALTDRLAAAPNVIFRALGHEAVVVSLDDGLYFGLDDVGTRIWMLMDQHDLSSVADALVREFDVTPERAATDVLALAEQLAAHGLVTRVPSE